MNQRILENILNNTEKNPLALWTSMGLMDPNGPFSNLLKYSQKFPSLYFCEIFELQSLENTQKINRWLSSL
jgi:hypothetical protein